MNRRTRRRPSLLRALLMAAALASGTSAPVFAADEETTGMRVGANLVFWDQARGIEAIRANADVLTEVSPFWYRVLADGSVDAYRTAAGATYEDWGIVSYLQSRGILVMATVANVMDGNWDGPLVSRIISTPELKAANITALVDLAVAYGYDGIDLDYEDLKGQDRAAFSAFVRDLAAALHARGKLLAVNVYGKTAEPGTWDGPIAQDWRAIAQYADHVRIMAYEYHWSTSAPGAIAPQSWVKDVLAFARTTMPAHKITHGLPLYGYDWAGTSAGTALVWADAVRLSQQYGAAIQWDAATAAPWFQYSAKGRQHTVWFENGDSVDAKLQLARAYDVGGVNLWRLGGEDRDLWASLRSTASVVGTSDFVPPTVALTSPTSGDLVTRKQKLAADAADDVGIARVEFYLDGELLATDTVPPYVTYWNTRKVPSGLKTFSAVAYDLAGNTGVAHVTVRVP